MLNYYYNSIILANFRLMEVNNLLNYIDNIIFLNFGALGIINKYNYNFLLNQT